MSNKWLVGLSIISSLAGCATAIYAYKVSKKTDKLTKKIDLAADNIADDIDIDISETVIEAATSRAINRAVDKEIENSMSWLKDVTELHVKNDVKSAIDSAYTDVKDAVRTKLARELEDVDISAVKDEVIERAAEKASEKFDKEFKKLIGNYNSKLGNIFDMYSSTLNNFLKTRASDSYIPGYKPPFWY